MKAVENGQTETVKHILQFKFTPSNAAEFERSKSKRDHHGNNALHLAHKNGYKDCVKLLRDHGIGDENNRNHRGLIPVQMNHKKIIFGEGD
jgi:ankyrin repeat protein